MRAPPDIQTSSTLVFLKEALRQDKYIQKWCEATPEEVVAQTVEYQPIQRADKGIYVLDTQMPVLALNIESATAKRRGASWGRVSTYSLWYLFRSFQAEGLELHGFEKNERWKSLMAWRIVYWLKKQRLYTQAAGGDEPTMDLQEMANIRTLDIGAIQWLDVGEFQGLKFSLTIEHQEAPYEEVSPATLDLLDWKIYTFDDAAPTTPELEVEADYDQT